MDVAVPAECLAIFISISGSITEAFDSQQLGFTSAYYRQLQDSSVSTAVVAQCAFQRIELQYGGAKVLESDQVCFGSTYDWLCKGIAEPGFLQLLKYGARKQFVPAFPVYKDNGEHVYFQTDLPFGIREGYGYTVDFSLESATYDIEMSLLADTLLNFALHVAFMGWDHEIIFDTRVNGVWTNRVVGGVSPIDTDGKVYSVTIKAESGGYRLSVDGAQKYLYTEGRPFDEAKIFYFSPYDFCHGHLHRLVFFTE